MIFNATKISFSFVERSFLPHPNISRAGALTIDTRAVAFGHLLTCDVGDFGGMAGLSKLLYICKDPGDPLGN